MRLPLILLGALAGAAAAGAADEKAVPLVLRLEDQANAIWSSLPSAAGDPRLTRLGDAPAECVTSALAEARRLLAHEQGARAALRDVSLELAVPRTVADRLAQGGADPSLLAPYVTGNTRGDHAVQPLGEASCGAYYELRGADGEPGRIVLALQLEAGCGCTQGGVRLHLLAQAALTPGVLENKHVLRLRTGDARYEVLASCEPCGAATRPGPDARARPAGGDACGNLCAPLAQGLAAWQQEATAATARLEDLAGKATALQLQVTTDRNELARAESARSRTRAVLERISALQARIKAAEAELARVRQASEDVSRTLAALRRVAGDTEGAEARCRAQCQARPPQKARASTTGDSGGGGIPTAVLVGGGAALAAGGAVALSSQGGSDAPAATADFSGLWRGTRVVIGNVGAANPCRRVYDETWQIRQNDRNLEVDVTSVTTDCGQPACDGNCGPDPSFQRQHVGTAEGTAARIYVYSDHQIPSCVLPLTLQGSTLRGVMPACQWDQPLPVSHDVVLQRVTR